MTIQRMRITCWVHKTTHTHTHTHTICNPYYLSTTTVVSRTRLNTLYIHCLSLIFQTGGGDNTFLRNVGILILCFTVSISRNVFAYLVFCGLSHKQYEYWERIPIQQEHNDARSTVMYKVWSVNNVARGTAVRTGPCYVTGTSTVKQAGLVWPHLVK